MARHTARRLGQTLVVGVVLACAASVAHADGTVLRVDASRAYIDIGAADGVGEGTRLTLLNKVVVRHPVTGAKLRDSFPIGTLRVIKAGKNLCLAAIPKRLLKRIRVGDAVRIASAKRLYEDPWQRQVEATKPKLAKRPTSPGPPSSGEPTGDQAATTATARKRLRIEAAAARAAWRSTLGKPPSERAAIWKRFLDTRRKTPYRSAIRAEIVSMERVAHDLAAASQARTKPHTQRAADRAMRLMALEPLVDLGKTLALRMPDFVYEDAPLALSFSVLSASPLSRAWLYFRRAGETGYQRMSLAFDGDGYLRGTIPAKAVRAPGVELFVEAIGVNDDPPRAVFGTQTSPEIVSVSVAPRTTPPSRKGRSRVTMFTDFVDFDGSLNKGFDQYVQAEIDFMYRFYKPIYSLRVGFGTLSGTGGPKDVIDRDPTNTCRDENGVYRCRRVSYNFAYTEIEIRHSDMLAFMIRPQYGTGTSDRRMGAGRTRCTGADTEDCDIFTSMGLRGRVRIGRETETNLVLGVGFTESVGTLIEAAFTWDVLPVFPVVLSFQVTDQPVPEDFGVRLIADVGWRALDWVYPSLRLAYQARDIDHAGVSGGLAVNFDW